MSAQRFHLGDLLSITDGHLLAPDHMTGVYRIVDFVTGQPHFTHQLVRGATTIKPWLLEQHPWLADIAVPDAGDEADYIAWMAWAVAQHGEFHDVEPMPFGMYIGREPIAELVEMVGRDRVIAVQIDPEATS